jgi:hypothetical protein
MGRQREIYRRGAEAPAIKVLGNRLVSITNLMHNSFIL